MWFFRYSSSRSYFVCHCCVFTFGRVSLRLFLFFSLALLFRIRVACTPLVSPFSRSLAPWFIVSSWNCCVICSSPLLCFVSSLLGGSRSLLPVFSFSNCGISLRLTLFSSLVCSRILSECLCPSLLSFLSFFRLFVVFAGGTSVQRLISVSAIPSSTSRVLFRSILSSR